MGIWAAVKYALNSTLGTSSFSPIDKIVNRLWGGVQTFTTDGTFTVPENVTKIWVTAAAGGQAGAIGERFGSSTYIYSGGLGGNGGDCILKKAFNVTPGQKIAITVGKGGTTAGAIGTATVIGSLITLAGGNNTNNGSNNGGGSGGKGTYINSDGDRYFSMPGQDGLLGSGGGIPAVVINSNSRSLYGGGGGGSIGNGGNGAVSGTVSENTGVDGVMGGGGGGSFSNYSAPFGKGGDGIVIIEW